ncbi:MAG: hypothetical protein Q8P13_00485 [bacterium]|nr:hypothetical protein [bacterium]
MAKILSTVSALPAFLLLGKPAFAAQVTAKDGYVHIDQLTVLFGNVLNAIAILAGFVVLIYLIIGGFRYMTAQGDPKALSQARLTLFWAVAGLVFIIASYLIIGFIAQFTGIGKIGTFCVPGLGGINCPA